MYVQQSPTGRNQTVISAGIPVPKRIVNLVAQVLNESRRVTLAGPPGMMLHAVAYAAMQEAGYTEYRVVKHPGILEAHEPIVAFGVGYTIGSPAVIYIAYNPEQLSRPSDSPVTILFEKLPGDWCSAILRANGIDDAELCAHASTTAELLGLIAAMKLGLNAKTEEKKTQTKPWRISQGVVIRV